MYIQEVLAEVNKVHSCMQPHFMSTRSPNLHEIEAERAICDRHLINLMCMSWISVNKICAGITTQGVQR